MTTDSFSINPQLIKTALKQVEDNLEEIDSRLEDIYRKAVIKDIPLVQSIVYNMQPSPEDCKMLSKVFDRLATVLAHRNQIAQQGQALKAISNQKEWLYEQVGDKTRDVDSLLESIFNETPESESQ